MSNETFGFKTTNAQTTINELMQFEDKMLELIRNIQFRNTNSDFQKQLFREVNNIRNDNNVYRVNTKSHKQLMTSAVTKSFKKAPPSALSNIISEEKKIAKNLNLQTKNSRADRKPIVCHHERSQAKFH